MRLGIWVAAPRHQVGVCLVGFNNKQQILLLRHVFHPTAPWSVPGGWLESREDPGLCALRELEEETGIVTDSAELGPVVHISREGPPTQVVIAFAGWVHQDPVSLSAEIIEWGWFDPDDLPAPLLPFVQTAIDKAVAYTAACHSKLEPVKV